jgi:hypothetical protein
MWPVRPEYHSETSPALEPALHAGGSRPGARFARPLRSRFYCNADHVFKPFARRISKEIGMPRCIQVMPVAVQTPQSRHCNRGARAVWLVPGVSSLQRRRILRSAKGTDGSADRPIDPSSACRLHTDRLQRACSHWAADRRKLFNSDSVVLGLLSQIRRSYFVRRRKRRDILQEADPRLPWEPLYDCRFPAATHNGA